MHMRCKPLWIFLALTAYALNTTQAAPLLTPQPQQSQAAHLSAYVLTLYQYKPAPLDDTLSSKIFDSYFKMLDSEKVFFYRADIDQFAIERTRLDDAIINGDLSIPFTIYNLYQQRKTERITYARSLLKIGFDFTKEESYQLSRKDAPWAKSEDEMNDLWRKRVKNAWLSLKLAGKDDKSIAETLDKRYADLLNRMSKTNSDDVFQDFMNSYAMSVDPHTNYFGVRASEAFDISMSLSITGIGAVLQDKDEYVIIKELVAGGPAALSDKLKVGDRIVGVGQGPNGSITDVVGWRIDDTVELIRGTENSVVLLDVLPAEAGPDGKHKLISLVRKKISLAKQAAKKSIIEVRDGNSTRRIGVISLHGFYQDVAARQKDDKDFKSATRDVSRLLEELKKDKADSVLVDLRNNGGGSLNEAIELTGLFIGKGPVVQERDSKGNISVEGENVDGVVWNGPVGVLINHASASASEIFAAAIQDYGRGVVIGEPSYGKGTVQTMVDLDKLAKSKKPVFGELKMTVAQFFRVNGGATQLHGVTPDIGFAMMANAGDFGESSYDNALPWGQIKATEYTPIAELKSVVKLLLTSHDRRIRKDRDFQILQENIAELSKLRKKNIISLNEADRLKGRKALESRLKSHQKDGKPDHGDNAADNDSGAPANGDDGMQPSKRNPDADLTIEKTNKIPKDVFLDEAVNILSDEVGLLKDNPELADSIRPKLVTR